MTAHIALPRTLRIGGGAVAEVGLLARELGAARPLIVTDAFILSTGLAERVLGLLDAEGLAGAIFSDCAPDPGTDSLVPALAAIADHGADLLVALGGGSSIDTAKAVALLAVQGGEMRDYRAPVVSSAPVLPIIAVPTTAGTGSESTQFTVITDDRTGEKMLCPGPSFLPSSAIIDFELTLSMPPRLTADTGIDALTHAIEAYVSRRANPFSDGLALLAMQTIGRCLRPAFADGGDRDAREGMMLAATQAGLAFSNSSVALVHGMSRPLGAHFHFAHGLSNAMLFPAVTAFSLQHALPRYAICARMLGWASGTDSDSVAGDALVDGLAQLSSDLDVPTPASRGVARADWEAALEVMAREALASGSPANNPRVPSADEIVELYRSIYK